MGLGDSIGLVLSEDHLSSFPRFSETSPLLPTPRFLGFQWFLLKRRMVTLINRALPKCRYPPTMKHGLTVVGLDLICSQ